MGRLLIVTLVTGCVATVVLAKQPQVRYERKDGRTIKVVEEEVPMAVESERARLQSTYLNLANTLADDLSDAELQEEVRRLKEQRDQLEKEKLQERMATEIESRLVAEYEFFLGLIDEHPRGSEVALVAEVMRTTLQDKIEFVRKWKAGKVKFPLETVNYDQLLSNDPPPQQQ